MKRLFFILLLGALRCAAADGVTTSVASHNSIGTVYNYTITYSGNTYYGEQAYWEYWAGSGPPGTGYTYQYQVNRNDFPGKSPAFTTSGQFTVPDGQTGRVSFNYVNSSNQWQYTTTSLLPGEKATCPIKSETFTVDNRTGTMAREIKIYKDDSGIVTQVGGSVSVNGGSNTSFANNGSVIIPIGSVGFFGVSTANCGVFRIFEKAGDGVYYETTSDPPVEVETRLPDPTPAPSPTVNNPTDASNITTVPNPSAAFPQRITDGGMTEDRWTKGILDVVRNIGVSSQVSGLNSQTSAQADAYNAQRLQAIDTNIATLTRNSNEERADRTASNARMDAIKNNTKAAADALKDDPSITQKHFEQTADATHHTDLNDGLVKGLASKMPNAPSVTLPTNQSTFSMTFTPPGLTTAQTVSFDLSTYDTPINVFKVVVRAALTVAFFFLTVKTLRSAFSG